MNQKDDERILWATFKSGDKQAYEILYRRYAPLMYNYGFKFTCSSQITQDAIQDVFTNLLLSRERLGAPFSIKHYLYKSLRREIFRQSKTRERLVYEDTVQEADFEVEFSFEDQLINEEISQSRQNALLNAVNQLPKRQKEAIFLRYFDELSYEEIADIMGIEQNSVYKTMYKAIESLFAKLSPEERKLVLYGISISAFL